MNIGDLVSEFGPDGWWFVVSDRGKVLGQRRRPESGTPLDAVNADSPEAMARLLRRKWWEVQPA